MTDQAPFITVELRVHEFDIALHGGPVARLVGHVIYEAKARGLAVSHHRDPQTMEHVLMITGPRRMVAELADTPGTSSKQIVTEAPKLLPA